MSKVIYERASETAKKVRVELKRNFPGVKFSVTSSEYAGGCSIRVRWIDGPSKKEVEAITDRFEGASFDGMTDMKSYKHYEYEGQLYSGADYIFTDRDMSEELENKLNIMAQKVWGATIHHLRPYQAEQVEQMLKAEGL